MGSGKVLPFLCENTVSLQVAIQSKIPHNVERVIHLLQRSAGFVPPMPAPLQVLIKNLPALLCGHTSNGGPELRKRVTHVRIQNSGNDFLFRLCVVID